MGVAATADSNYEWREVGAQVMAPAQSGDGLEIELIGEIAAMVELARRLGLGAS
jgi:hypothetical protein